MVGGTGLMAKEVAMRVFRIIIQSVDHGEYQADNEDEALLTCVPDQDRAAQLLGLSVDQWRRDQVQIIEQLKPGE